MTTKKAIENLTAIINENYLFYDGEKELVLTTQKTFKGYQIALIDTKTRSWLIVFTQHQEVAPGTALLILQMLFHDILERQSLGHYTVIRRE